MMTNFKIWKKKFLVMTQKIELMKMIPNRQLIKITPKKKLTKKISYFLKHKNNKK